jgi:hypothetical protein
MYFIHREKGEEQLCGQVTLHSCVISTAGVYIYMWSTEFLQHAKNPSKTLLSQLAGSEKVSRKKNRPIRLRSVENL